MEVWQWKLITASTQLATETVYIKSIIQWTTTASSVGTVIYNLATNACTAGAMFLTIWGGIKDTKVIMFDNPCQLDAGCYIDWEIGKAGGLLVQFKPV